MCSACRLMVFNVCVKFHENMSSGFKVMERIRKLLTHTHTHRKDENIIPPWHTSYAGCITSDCDVYCPSLVLKVNFTNDKNFNSVSFGLA